MRRQVEALVEELIRLKGEGVTHVPVSQEAMTLLRAVIPASPESVTKPARTESVASPAPVRYPEGHVHSSEAAETLTRIFDEKKKRTTIASSNADSDKGAVKTKPAEPLFPPPPEVVLPEGDKSQRWNALRDQVLNCPVCNAHLAPGKKVVFGIGSLDADIFFCGEAPGADEETAGEPFVGPAGQLLNKIIGGMGLGRDDVYIGNILNWRPEHAKSFGNRPPTTEEMAFCLPYLKAQIEVIDPKVVVALGATAVKGLLGPKQFTSMGKMRGQWHDLNGRPLMITYHPSYLLRDVPKRTKREVWEDMLLVLERAGLPVSDKQRGYYR